MNDEHRGRRVLETNVLVREVTGSIPREAKEIFFSRVGVKPAINYQNRPTDLTVLTLVVVNKKPSSTPQHVMRPVSVVCRVCCI